jgi:uncharacterized protein
MPVTLRPARRGVLPPGTTLACALVLAACISGVAAPARAQSGPLQDLATFPRTQLTVVHHDAAHGPSTHQFDVWVADTPERAEQGLMFVTDLPDSRGMIFPLSPPRIERMWMKNTYIELDMLFVDPHGRISKIITKAHPLSLTTLSSDEPVSAVVELKGGAAARLSLAVGDLVSWQPPASANPSH